MNRTIYAQDCLDVLDDKSAIPDESVDLIYLDPPFNSKSKYNLPFKGKLEKDAKPVEAFKDTWNWDEFEAEEFRKLELDVKTRQVADLIKFAQAVHGEHKPAKKISTGAYLLNMYIRLAAMKRVLKPTGSIYLHCDPTASHYLKLLMDFIYGEKRFRNEIVWGYTGPGHKKMRQFNRKHDTIFWYSNTSENWCFNINSVCVEHDDKTKGNFKEDLIGSGFHRSPTELSEDGKVLETWWIQKKGNGLAIAPRQKHQYLGYPTQKPIALLERIIKASSNEGDLVLDPFCGCGTTLHAAEKLGRQWIGIDISAFSAGLVRERITSNFVNLTAKDIRVIGVPLNVEDALQLARSDPFEFEKWACGAIGAHGMFHEPGTKGSDGGVDGIINFGLYKGLKKVEPTFALVQVKGGKVTPDSVRALTHSVQHFKAQAGIMICFENYMATVENNRLKGTFEDLTGKYPVIQGLSVESLLEHKRPNLPPLLVRGDGKMVA